MRRFVRRNHHRHRRHKYLNLFFVGLSLVFAFYLSRMETFHTFLLQLGNLGYIGAFIGGALFVSTFTVATGALILLIFAEKLSPVEIGIIAALGAVLTDLTIFRILQDDLLEDLQDVYNHFGGRRLSFLLHTKYFRWTLPVIGALIIASPLPDEIGVSLMGLSKMSTGKFMVISFVLNFIGIFTVISLLSFTKP